MSSSQPVLHAWPTGGNGAACFRRVVAVQGAVQLVSALAAMRTSARQKGLDRTENHLIVHDLSSPGDQAKDFAACLHALAEQSENWASMHYFPLPEMLRLQGALKEGGWDGAIAAMHQTLGFERCDELLLGQNMLFINNLLSRSYPPAEKACYGDGIALNFTAEYYTPANEEPLGLRSIGRRFEHWFRRRWKAALGKPVPPPPAAVPMKSKKHAVAFDKHYLLLPNQFDQHLERFEQLESSDFANLFDIFAESLIEKAGATCAALESALQGASQVIVLLTSNFSETKRMTLEGEVKCCMDMVRREQHDSRAVLVIKPHPRDSAEKIAVLEQEAAKSFRRVVTLTDPWTFYVPFESIFVRYFASNPRIAPVTSVVCSSSACISLELLYGQRCELGFGSRNVRRYFAPKWQKLRQRHEGDLLRVMHHVRRMRSGRAAA